jgi:hypothetical protein
VPRSSVEDLGLYEDILGLVSPSESRLPEELL